MEGVFNLRVRWRAAKCGHVGFEIDQLAQNFPAPFDGEGKVDIGKAVLEPFDHRHDRIRVRCADPQLLYADLPPISEELDRLLLAPKQRSGNPKKRLARFRKFVVFPIRKDS